MKKFQKTNLNEMTIKTTLNQLAREIEDAAYRGDEETTQKLAKQIAEIEKAL